MQRASKLLLICIFPLLSFSQQLFFNHLTVNNGLTQGVNNCIFQDTDGYIWISSYDGLNRFDGSECRKFYADPVKPGGLRGTLFLNILEDRLTNLWIGSNEGLNWYNRSADSFYCFKPDTGYSAGTFCSPFHIDHLGNVWLQSGSGIYIFYSSSRVFRKISTMEQGVQVQVKAWPGKLYSQVQKLFVLEPASAILREAALQENAALHWIETKLPALVGSVNGFVLSGSKCWLLTGSGLFAGDVLQKDKVFALQPRTAGIPLTALHEDAEGSLWLGSSDKGLYRTDPAGSFLEHHVSRSDDAGTLAGNRVVYITTDRNRNLWVAIWGKGVDYTHPSRFHFNRYIGKSEAAAAGTDNFIRSVVETGNEIWCATQSGGIAVLDSLRRIRKVIRRGLPASLEHLCVQGKTVWVASFEGLFAIESNSGSVQRIPVPPAIDRLPGARQFNYCCLLPDGALLLSSNAGMFVVRPSGHSMKWTKLTGISGSDVYLTSAYAGNGRVFISRAFKGFGMYRMHGDSLTEEAGFPLHATVKCFTPVNDSLLWVGSTIGLIRVNIRSRRIEKIYTTGDGLANQYVYAVLPAGEELWLSTNAGLVRFNAARGTFKTYTTADGLLSNEFNTYAFCHSRSGEFLFGGVNGLNSCYPYQQERYNASPALVLSAIKINDSVYRYGHQETEKKQWALAYNRNTLELQFTVIDFTNAGAAYIRYMLEGYDKQWVQAANKSVIRYVKLPPGKYQLRVKGFSADGIESKASFSMAVWVEPPWWQRWWFILLLLVVGFLLVFSVIKMYLNKKLSTQRILLEKELAVEQERIRMARELHDGLGSMLSGIKHSLSAIGNEAALTAEQHVKFDYTVDKLDESIKDLRAVSHGMFSAELLQQGLEAALSNYCSATAAATSLQITFECIGLKDVVIPGEQAFQLFRIVQELLQNVVRHAGAGAAIVQLSFHEGLLSLTVEDNGKGFDLQQLRSAGGIGLKNVESRVKILKGKMDIQSQPDRGTSVLVEMPV